MNSSCCQQTLSFFYKEKETDRLSKTTGNLRKIQRDSTSERMQSLEKHASFLSRVLDIQGCVMNEH